MALTSKRFIPEKIGVGRKDDFAFAKSTLDHDWFPITAVEGFPERIFQFNPERTVPRHLRLLLPIPSHQQCLPAIFCVFSYFKKNKGKAPTFSHFGEGNDVGLVFWP